MAVSSSSTYDAVAVNHARYAAELRAAGFAENECEDIVQTVLLAAWSDGAADGHTVEQFEAYVRKAARSTAISFKRDRQGQGAVKRTYDSFEEEEHAPGDFADPATLVVDEHEELEHRRVLLAAYDRLPAVNKAAIRDRYTLNLSVGECAARRDLPATKFERLFTASVQRLRVILSQADVDACMRARFELDVARDSTAPVDPGARGFAQAHISTCLACKTHSFGRREGLLGALPLPAVGLAHRLVNRLPGFGGQADRVAAAATATEIAGGAGLATTGAGGALLLGFTAKGAAVGACTLIATGACIFGGQQILLDKTPERPVAAKKDDTARRPARAPAPAKAAAVVPAVVAIARSRSDVPARTTAPAQARSSSSSGGTRARPKKRTASSRSSRPAPATVRSAAPAPVAPTPAPTPAAAPAPAPSAPQPAPTAAPSSQFSTEFAP